MRIGAEDTMLKYFTTYETKIIKASFQIISYFNSSVNAPVYFLTSK